MIEIAELNERGWLQLPPGIAERFHASDRFVVWMEGDALYLKRISRRAITDLVEQAPEGQPVSLEDINKIVHEVRRRRRAS